MITSLKDQALSLYTNLRGWRTSRKLVVFESDDWGAIRMPSKAAHRALRQAGIPVDRWRYDSLDCLERQDDLEYLFEILSQYRDVNDNSACFTFNTVMGNPDFEAISWSNFERFSHQNLFDSYKVYHGQDLKSLWLEAMKDGVIRPQFHAREHINTSLWMRDLQSGARDARLAFDYKYYGMITKTSSRNQRNYLAAYWPDSWADLEYARSALKDGLHKFYETFGFSSKTFVACNYIWPLELEPILAEYGITLIQGQRAHLVPDPHKEWDYYVRRRFTGQSNSLGQKYSVRNVLFEPFLDPTRDWVAEALSFIRQAFQLRRPAIISTHRVNYVGGMKVSHRDDNLRLLANLLSSIVSMWPDVEFVSSDTLGLIMSYGISHNAEAVLEERR